MNFPKKNTEFLACVKVARMMCLVVNPMGEFCWNCFFYEYGWCDDAEEEVDEDGWCENWEETEDDNIG